MDYSALTGHAAIPLGRQGHSERPDLRYLSSSAARELADGDEPAGLIAACRGGQEVRTPEARRHHETEVP